MGSRRPGSRPASACSDPATSAQVSASSLFSFVVSTRIPTLTSIKPATAAKMGVKDWSAG